MNKYSKKLILLFVLWLMPALVCATSTITTVAGTGVAGYSGDGGAATSAKLKNPPGVAIDSSGNVYIADSFNNVVRKVDHTTNIITTFAGTNVQGSSGDGGAATSAQLYLYVNTTTGPDVAVDSNDDVYIADYGNCTVRKVDHTTGIITRFAGTIGTCSSTGDGGLATAATIDGPNGLGFDSSNNLYITTNAGNRIRKVDHATLKISPFAGTGANGTGGDGGLATAAKVYNPRGGAAEYNGNIYLSDSRSQSVREVNSTGYISKIAGSGTTVTGYSGDGGLATSSNVNYPWGVAVDGSGNIYFCDEANNVVRKVDAINNYIYTVAGINGQTGYSGDGGLPTSAKIGNPKGCRVVTSGTTYYIYFADSNNHAVRKITVPQPVLSATSTSSLSFTSVTLNGTSDTTGTGFWVVLPAAAAAPAASWIALGKDSTGAAASFSGSAAMTAGVAKAFSVTGLSDGTSYNAYLVARDNSSIAYSTVATLSFTTPQPVLSATSTSSLLDTTVSLNSTSNYNGTGYWVVLPSAAAAPSAAQVAAGKDSFGTAVALSGNSAMVANVAGAFSITGLTAGTAYKVYLVVNASGDLSSVSTASFTTYTPPTVSAFSTSNLLDTTVTLNATSDNTGTGYWVVLPSAAAAPSVAQVEAGQDSTGAAVALSGSAAMTATVAKAFSISGLTAGTAYKIYFAAKSTATTLGSVEWTANITTLTPPTVTALSTSTLLDTTVTLNATSDNTGTGYWVVLPSAAAAPSVAQVKAGQDSTGTAVAAGFSGNGAMTANTSTPFSISGLTQTTAYKVYFVTNSTATTLNSVEWIVSFTTLPKPTLSAVSTSGLISTAVTLNGTSSLNGTGYWIVLPSAAAFASAAQVAAGQDSFGAAVALSGNSAMVANVAGSFSITGLTPMTSYRAALVVNASGVLSAISYASFTTPAVGLYNTSTSALTGTSVTLNATIDTTGTGYWVILPSSVAAPTAAQVVAGQDGTGAAAGFSGNAAMTAATAQTFNVAGLSRGVQYNAYLVGRAGGQNSVVYSLSFSTPVVVSNVAVYAINITPTSAELNATSDTTGTGYWVLLPSPSSSPSSAQILFGQDSAGQTATNGNSAITANVETNFNFSKLTMGKSYDAYLVVKSTGGVNSSISTTTFYTTLPNANTTASSYQGPKEPNQGKVVITPSGNGGNPYTVDWSNAGSWDSSVWFQIYANGVLQYTTAPGARVALIDLSNASSDRTLRSNPNFVVCAVNQYGSSCQPGPIDTKGHLLLIIGLMAVAVRSAFRRAI